MTSTRRFSLLVALLTSACTVSFTPSDAGPSAEPPASGLDASVPRSRLDASTRERPDAGPYDAARWQDGPWIDGWFQPEVRTEPLRFETEGPFVFEVGEYSTIVLETNLHDWKWAEYEVVSGPDFVEHGRGRWISFEAGPGDVGTHRMVVEARYREERASAELEIEIVPAGGATNEGPMWLPVPDIEETGAWHDPGGTAEWPIVRTATVIATICDEEGHDITFEIEAVRRGRTRRAVPTHQETLPSAYLPWGSRDPCAEFRISLNDLPDGRYTFWGHAVDELGAEDPYGWVEFRSFELRAE